MATKNRTIENKTGTAQWVPVPDEEGTKLGTGVNKVDAALFEKLVAHPYILSMIKSGQMVTSDDVLSETV